MKSAAIVWWIIWFNILNGLMMIYVFIGPKSGVISTRPTNEPSIIEYLYLLPLLISVALRWVVIPRVPHRQTAFVVFMVGLALAESSGILAIVLHIHSTREFVTLSLLGILQWAPLFARKFYLPADPTHGLRVG